ncbi:MAG: hypothetical protein PWQ06_118 [Anaerophaga sp.]|nr:hypothetical protein [Anaerophaga sp.]
MDQMLEIYLQYEQIMDKQRETISSQQELIKQLTMENINLKQIITETADGLDRGNGSDL